MFEIIVISLSVLLNSVFFFFFFFNFNVKLFVKNNWKSLLHKVSHKKVKNIIKFVVFSVILLFCNHFVQNYWYVLTLSCIATFKVVVNIIYHSWIFKDVFRLLKRFTPLILMLINGINKILSSYIEHKTYSRTSNI